MKPWPQVAAYQAIALIATLLMAAPAAAAPDDPDPSFGAGGLLQLPLASQFAPIAALQPDGKLLLADITQQSTGNAANPSKSSWLIRRYTTDGSSDLSFGTNSNVVVSFDVTFSPDGNVGNDHPTGIALLPDGRFVVAGTSLGACAPAAGCESALVMARFNADGTIDDGFGSNGKVIAPGPGADSVAIQSDGKVLALSNLGSLFVQANPYLRRLNVDGSADSSFAPTIGCIGNGKLRLSQDGKIVVAATLPIYPNTAGFCIARLDVDGTPDAAFGTEGISVVGAGASGLLSDFFIDASGGIVVAGSTTAAVLFRLTTNGSLDPRFGSGGMVAIDALQPITAVTGDCHGRTIVAGAPSDGEGFLMARFLQDGSIDTGFSRTPGGFSRTSLVSSSATQLLVRPNGPIVALAVAQISPPSYSLFILQYLGDLPCGETVAVEYHYLAWNYYFETAFADEIAALDGGAFGGAWQRTGETFNVWQQPNASASPTCRFFSKSFAPRSSHFYTPFPAECVIVKTNPSWQFESIAFYIQIPDGYGTGNGSCPQGTVALYRAYNNGMGGAPNHRYTTSLATLNTMLGQGWVFEGEANTKVFACAPQ